MGGERHLVIRPVLGRLALIYLTIIGAGVFGVLVGSRVGVISGVFVVVAFGVAGLVVLLTTRVTVDDRALTRWSIVRRASVR